MAIVPMVPAEKATKTKLDHEEAAIIKSLKDREAVLYMRLSYIARIADPERREIERAEVQAELTKVQAALNWFLGVPR